MGFPYNYPNYGSFGYNPPNFAPPAPQTAQPSVSAPQGFSCRPVTSRAEAEVFQIPFDGSTTYFVDTANGKIYAKTFNFNDGTAPLVTFVRETAAPAVQYATVDDLNALRAEIAALKKPRKVVVEDEHGYE